MRQRYGNDCSVSGDPANTYPLSAQSDAELLAQLLAGPAALARSHVILKEFGGLGGLARQRI